MELLSIDQLTGFLAAYGCLAVFLLVAVESMGIPVPGETMLTVAAVYAGSSGRLPIAWVIAAAAAGAIVGDNFGYLIGRLGGYALLRRLGPYLRLDEQRLQGGGLLFKRHGGKAVFFGRFVAILRMWAAFLAGTYRMAWRRFLICNALGGITWATLYGLAGYVFGGQILAHGRTIGILTFVLGTAAMVGLSLSLRRVEARLTQAAEPASGEAPLPLRPAHDRGILPAEAARKSA